MNLNLEEIKNKILTDVKYQIIILMILILFVAYISLKPNKPKRKEPCFNLTLKVWGTFERDKFLNFVSPFASLYCLRFDYSKKDLTNLEKEFIYSLASGEAPDLIYGPNYFVYRNKKYLTEIKIPQIKTFFQEKEIEDYGTPVNLDSLSFIYNKRIFDFFNYQPPKTLEELNSLLVDFNKKNFKDFYLIGLGTSEVVNKKEIILVLSSLKEKNLYSLIDFYFDYSKENSPNFALKRNLGNNDLNLFASEKLGAIFGFYQDLKYILKINPRISYEVSSNPLETFPPSAKNFVKTFYFAIPKASKNSDKIVLFLEWFYKDKNYQNFVKDFDLIPVKETIDLEPLKEIFIKNAKFGSTYLDFISQENYSEFEKVLEIWENNPQEGARILQILKISF